MVFLGYQPQLLLSVVHIGIDPLQIIGLHLHRRTRKRTRVTRVSTALIDHKNSSIIRLQLHYDSEVAEFCGGGGGG